MLKMSLIQPLKIRTLKIAIFKTVVTVAICCNWPKTANSRELPDFQKFKIDFGD